jgi:hypothetical protein
MIDLQPFTGALTQVDPDWSRLEIAPSFVLDEVTLVRN